MEFTDLKKTSDNRTFTFTLSPIHVTYANTLRRLILTGVETVAFRSDMTSTGSTSDVLIKKNDTPMTNEMLADRIGLVPVHVSEPLTWKDKSTIFTLKSKSNKDNTTYVTASDFKVTRVKVEYDEKEEKKSKEKKFRPKKKSVKKGGADDDDSNESDLELNSDSNSDVSNSNSITSENVEALISAQQEEEEEEEVEYLPTEEFFRPHPITNITCLIATLQPGFGQTLQQIEIVARASIGTGREHARFCPVSQCSYEYSLDSNPQRIEEMFQNWLVHSKKISNIDKTSDRYMELKSEFNTMQIKRCFKINEKKEPYSFDFTIETIGVLSIPYIVRRACQVGENMCNRYANIHRGNLPEEITVTTANSRLIGFDFLIRGHDHTLGNLLQTGLVENLIENDKASPKITYAGYNVPHPLRDEMVLRIGVEDGEEATARLAFSEAARGCVKLFKELREAWDAVLGVGSAVSKPNIRRPRIGGPPPMTNSPSGIPAAAIATKPSSSK